MEDEPAAVGRAAHGVLDADIAVNDLDAEPDKVAVVGLRANKRTHLVAALEQKRHQMPAEKACCASHEGEHAQAIVSYASWKPGRMGASRADSARPRFGREKSGRKERGGRCHPSPGRTLSG